MNISLSILLLILLIFSPTLLGIANAQPGPGGGSGGGGFQPPYSGRPQPPYSGRPQPPYSGSPQPPSGYCNKKCGDRCVMKGPGSRCMKFCLMCCAKCNCVPSGTYGNKGQCPCYSDWKSPNGRPKCP